MSQIVFSSSFDDKYSPMNILTSKKSQFWVSTGLYPQEILIDVGSTKQINSVNISGYNIKKLSIETCDNESAVNYNKELENEIAYKEGELQNFSLPFKSGNAVRLLKLIILQGYDCFCSINSIEINLSNELIRV